MPQLLSQYVLIDSFCLILAGLVLRKCFRGTVKELSYNYFTMTVYAVILYILGDMGWAIIEYTDFPGRIVTAYVVMTIYYVTPAFLSFFWYMFCEARIDKKSKFLQKGWIAFLPVIILTVLVVISSCGSYIVFSYEGGAYQRGPLYPAALVLEYISAVFSIAHAIVVILRHFRSSRANNLNVLLSFAVYPVLFGAMQIVFYSLPLESVGFALMLVSVLLDMKETEIMQDTLTQMNNRRCLNRYLETTFRLKSTRENICMCMIDIDGFKKINDTYGHVSGDEALTVTANVIKKTVNQINGFAARFGGDEFVIVFQKSEDAHPELLGHQLNESLALAAADAGLEYPLTLSVGFMTFDTATMKDASDLIKSADKYLYHNKAKSKAE